MFFLFLSRGFLLKQICNSNFNKRTATAAERAAFNAWEPKSEEIKFFQSYLLFLLDRQIWARSIIGNENNFESRCLNNWTNQLIREMTMRTTYLYFLCGLCY